MKDPDAKRLSSELDIAYIHALRLVQDAKRLAAKDKISYREAERLVVARNNPTPTPPPAPQPVEPTLIQLLRDAVEAVCIDLAYEEVEYEIDGRFSRGVAMGDVPLPRATVENIAIEIIEPDRDTLMWSVDEQYEGGTQVANVEVAANIIFDGYVHKSDAYGLDDDNHEGVTVVDYDWNDHMARVTFSRKVTLYFHAVIHPDLPEVDNLTYVGASDASELLPHPDAVR